MKLKYIIIYLRHNSLDIAILIAVLSAFFVVGIVAWLSMTSPESEAIHCQQKEYFDNIQREYETPAGERAWKRLNRKHGHPDIIVYEYNKTPYFVNKDGIKRRDRQPGDPQRCWRWACCTKKGFWFPDDEEMPGERKGCDQWE